MSEVFLSTPSARRATRSRRHNQHGKYISIHALREEGDFPSPMKSRPHTNFYPRPPRGGRLAAYVWHKAAEQFLSTPSARRATRARI